MHRTVSPSVRHRPGYGPRKSNGLPAVTCLSLTLAFLAPPPLGAAPVGGVVSVGQGTIVQSGPITTIRQGSDKLAINWNGFNIGSAETVNFIQPGSRAVALNRIVGDGATQIYGKLNANGQLFLVNPNGILFGPGASVNVGGLVASTLGLSDPDFLNGRYRFGGGSGVGRVINQGNITATDGGYVALLGGQVSNGGTLSARLGKVALAAGNAITLDFAGDGLLGVNVTEGALNALAQNRQLIRADGGTVLLTAKAADSLVRAVVNHDGVIEARTVDRRQGGIYLLGDMNNGVLTVAGRLDASALSGGNGGLVETSAAMVRIAEGTRVDTRAPSGVAGTWLIDPSDFTVAASGGDISGRTLSSNLELGNVILQSSRGSQQGQGDLVINDTVAWSADTRLTLTAVNHVKVLADLSATGNGAGLVINPNTANGGQTASGSGAFFLSRAAITLSGSHPSLSIAGRNYLVINDLASLQAINATLDNATYRYYALGSDLDARATAAWNGGQGFTPLGTMGMEFRGIFEGLGHTISNLTIRRPNSNFVGLIGYTSGGSMVRDIGLLNASITGHESVGGIVGRSYGDVYNAWISGSINGYDNVGGVVGQNNSSSIHIASTATVYGSLTTGGAVGASSGLISEAYATGSVSGVRVIGGLVGSTNGRVINSYATGNVSGDEYVGGLTGYNVAGAIITNSYAAGKVRANVAFAGALTGYNGNGARIVSSFWLAANGPGMPVNDGSIDGYSRGLGASEATLAATYAAVGWNIGNGPGASSWRIYDGNTMPLLRSYLRPVTVSATAVRDYDGSATGSIAYVASNGATLAGSLNVSSRSGNVGSYTTADGTLAAGGLYSAQDGYDIAYGAISLDIRPATLVVKANDASGLAGAPYSGGNGVSISGLVAGESAASLGGSLLYGGSAQGASAAGIYQISVGGLHAGNYRIRYLDGKLILQAPAEPSVAPVAPVATGARPTGDASDPARRTGRVNADGTAIALLPHADNQPRSGELFLRIVNGGMRLPQGLSEMF